MEGDTIPKGCTIQGGMIHECWPLTKPRPCTEVLAAGNYRPAIGIPKNLLCCDFPAFKIDPVCSRL